MSHRPRHRKPAVPGRRKSAYFTALRVTAWAGVGALRDQEHVANSRRHNARWHAWLIERLSGLGLQPHPSAGNFILVGFPEDPGRNADAAMATLKTQGILVRGMAAYGLPGCLRITIGTEEETRAVADALAEFTADAPAGARA